MPEGMGAVRAQIGAFTHVLHRRRWRSGKARGNGCLVVQFCRTYVSFLNPLGRSECLGKERNRHAIARYMACVIGRDGSSDTDHILRLPFTLFLEWVGWGWGRSLVLCRRTTYPAHELSTPPTFANQVPCTHAYLPTGNPTKVKAVSSRGSPCSPAIP